MSIENLPPPAPLPDRMAEMLGKAVQFAGDKLVELTEHAAKGVLAVLAMVPGVGGIAESISAASHSENPMIDGHRSEAQLAATPVTPMRASQMDGPSAQKDMTPPDFHPDVQKAALAAVSGVTSYRPMETAHVDNSQLNNLGRVNTPSRGMPEPGTGMSMTA